MKNLYLKLLSLLIVQAFAYQTAHAVMVQVGTLGTTTTTTSNTPYKTFWEDGRSQYLVLASEIISNGGSAGNINSLAFNVSTVDAIPLNGFTIKIGATALTALTNTFQPNGGFTTCYSATVNGTSLGWNTYIFSSPFVWNGSDNIIVEVCFDNASYTNNSGVHFNTLGFNANTHRNADGQIGCTMTASGVLANRPVMLFDIATGMCIDPPTAGTTVSSKNPICPSTNFNLSLVGGTTGIGQTYQWQDSPNGSVWSNIPGATNAMYTGTIINPTYFRCMVTCGMGTDSSSVLLQNVLPGYVCNYCPSYSTSTSDSKIDSVYFNTIISGSLPSSCESYTNYYNLNTTVSKGNSYPIKVRAGTCGGNYTRYGKVFIDYNHDGIFSDPAELVFSFGPTTLPQQNFLGNVFIAGSALTGLTGMRVVLTETGSLAGVLPCGTYSWGETEDYLINITGPDDDAGITSIDSPIIPSCLVGLSNISLTLNNWGNNNLTTATINYSVNGLLQSPYSFIGSIAPGGTQPGVVIGSYNFLGGEVLKVWTSNPNGVLDALPMNDTLQVVVATGLAGTYTIGAGGDYNSFNDAVNDLNNLGVCGSVVFNVDNTTFNEQIILSNVTNMSAVNTVTFRGTGSNSKLQYNSTTPADNYVIRFNNADHFIIDSLIIENTGTTYGYVLEFLAGSDSNMVSNSTLRSDTLTFSTSTTMSVVYSPSGVNNHSNSFMNNQIQGGSYGIYWYGISGTNLAKNLLVENNIFYNQYFRGLNLYYQENMKIRNNNIKTNSSYTGLAYQIYMFTCNNGFDISGNKLNWQKTMGTHYGIYGGTLNNLNNKKGWIYNNFILTGDTLNASSAYGIYLSSALYTNVYNNNFYARNNSAANYGIYYTGGGNNELLNNNIVLPKSGTAVYVGGTVNIANSNNNNLFAPNGNIGYYNGITYTTLNSWQVNTGFDASSLNIDPIYAGYTDLHTCEQTLVGAGVDIATITEDIDGEQRDSNKPYIGADVFFDLSADLLGAEVSKCPQDAVTLEVQGDSTQILSYSWTPGNLTTPSISVSNAGWYYVTITTACGSATDSIEVINEPLPIASFNITTTNQLTAVFADASTNATSWTWNFGDGNSSTQQNPFHIYNQSGTYTVTLIACNDCGCDTTTQVVTVLANSVNENFLQNVVSIYPNPNKGEFTISMNGVANAQIEITTIQGQVVYTEKISANGSINKNIHLNNATGMYFVKIIANEQTMISKVIVE
ncbi:MAG: T9SS type A sorting domain-containing protein [Flavobacteriales bacterium]|nr:T9SS type A sorting domain-containing protein [Flavobacteriales bacterium]